MRKCLKIGAIGGSLSSVLIGFLMLIHPFPASALPPLCSQACTWDSSCSFICRDETGGQITCYDWGVCRDLLPPPPPCIPQWVETGRTAVGAFQKNWFLYCELWITFDVTVHDVNNCGFGDRIVCDEAMYGHKVGFPYVDCCDLWPWGCWGKDGC